MQLRSLAVLGLALVACSSTKSNAAATTPDVTIPDGPTTFTMTQHVPASTEAFKCLYVQMPATDGFIVGGVHKYTQGSHHLLLYRTDLNAIPAAQNNGIVDCYEAAAGDMMSHIRGVAYAAETPTGNMVVPSGVGLPYKANDVLLFQTHYINPNGTDLDATAQVHVDVASGGVTTNASVLFFYAPFIDIPAGARAKAGMRCPVAKDVTLLSFASHYHARGVGYGAYLDPPAPPRATTPFYTSQSWSSPNISQNQAMPVGAGSHIRFECDYDNTQGTQEYVQGPSAANNEMCMFIGLYYPAMTDADDNCDDGDEYGQGTASCTSALSCLQKCPADGSDPSSGNFSPCIQACFVNACPAATAPLVDAVTCIQAKCADACGGSADAGDAGGDPCTTCVTQNCASQYLACSSAPCAGN